MDTLIDFFEELDEMVYVSDMETHELMYMNKKLRESLDFQKEESYVGKKCYEVLQGEHSPCRFCTNPNLKEHHFISWIHNNPVLKKKFLIKDSVVRFKGRDCRIEIAIDMETQDNYRTAYYYTRTETLLNECMRQFFSAANPEDALNKVLKYIGKTFQCDRVYVFEFDQDIANNTYEWCAQDVETQKEILQDIPLDSIDWWIELFENNDLVTIYDLETIREKYPIAYAILKPQHIDRLVAGPIIVDGCVSGLIGVDNPKEDMMSMLNSLLKVIGYFVISLLKRRDLLNHLHLLSYHDALTGAYNRNALYEHSQGFMKAGSIGLVYCDITGLKHVNDSLGHAEGDKLIQHSYQVIRNGLNTDCIYRVGGDEFLAVFLDICETEFMRAVKKLRQDIQKDKNHIASGYIWSDKVGEDLDVLISLADQTMYEDKKAYRHRMGESEIRDKKQREHLDGKDKMDSIFYRFLDTTYHDMEFLFRAMAQDNTQGYFYFGDMKKNVFFISDNMKDEFGFESNVVPALLHEWEKRIPSSKAREIYWTTLNTMFKEKRSIHDLRYQVRKADGRNIWIRCYGVLKWDEEKREPLFFAGRISHQDDEFVVDSATNFLRESAMFRCLEEVRQKGGKGLVIGFSLHNISEINRTRGRAYSDRLLKTIADELTEKLSDKISFYRLEGMRCVAIVDSAYSQDQEELVAKIRDIICYGYSIMGVTVKNPCSFALVDCQKIHCLPSDFLEELVALLRIAKHDSSQQYLEYSDESIQKARYFADQALALNRDVLNDMENFRIVIQPVVSAKDGSIIGGEVLLRWKFKGKDVSPAFFVPVLEKDNMIQPVGRWVFEQTVCTCMRLISYHENFYLSFNVSLLQLTDETFPDFMEKTLQKYRLDGSHLVAEMTESCMDAQPEKLLRFVETCKRMGIRIALDDFGSGYSSLRMLLQYPTNIIKLDKTLLGEMMDSLDKKDFISSIVYACHRFGKQVCMEGVETEEQCRMIYESGCDMIQGFFCYKPMEVGDVYRLLSKISSSSFIEN